MEKRPTDFGKAINMIFLENLKQEHSISFSVTLPFNVFMRWEFF
jgi:hypothetical protein